MANIPSYMLIRQYVIDLFFRHKDPAKPLPSEHELARKFNVSRTTIRLALDDLVKNGLLIRRSRSGMYLSPDYEIPTSGQYKKILLLTGDGKYLFYGGKMLRIYSKIYEYFSSREYRLVPIHLSTDFSPAEELSFYRPDGILWVQPEIYVSEEIKACAEKFPVQILFGYDTTLQNCSCVDYACGAEIAASFFKESGVDAPYLIGAGKSPIRMPFTEKWKSLFGAGRIISVMQSGKENLSALFRRDIPDGVFCFDPEIMELRSALPALPRVTITDLKGNGGTHVLDLSPVSEIIHTCRSLEKLIASHGKPHACRIIQPKLLNDVRHHRKQQK